MPKPLFCIFQVYMDGINCSATFKWQTLRWGLFLSRKVSWLLWRRICSTKNGHLMAFISGRCQNGCTAIFILVVSSAVLLHDVSARAGDVSMEITVFPIGWILSLQFERSYRATVRLRQRLTNVQRMREKVTCLKHVKLRVDTWAAKHTAADNHYENSCNNSFYHHSP